MEKLFIRLTVLVSLGLAPCLSPSVQAQAVQEQAESELEKNASAHFDKGVELYREGSLDAALVEFQRAYELIPNYRLLYNLGQIQAERHEYAAAISLFNQYLDGGGTEIGEARRAEAQQEIAKLRTRVSYLSVESNVEGARLFVNDVSVGLLPLSEPVAINSGVCNVRLEKAGFLPASQRIEVAGGEHPQLKLTLVEAGRARNATTSESLNYIPFWISAGTTVAFGAAALGFGLTARSADQDLDAALGHVPASTDEIEDARSRVRMYAGLTDASAVLSLLSLGFAVYFLIDPPKASTPQTKEPMRASLRILPSRRGVGLSATF